MTVKMVKYWHKIGDMEYEPLATSRAELDAIQQASFGDDPETVWCAFCQAEVKPEGYLDAIGLNERCQFCGEDLEEQI